VANALYPAFKQACLNGDINLPTADVKVLLVDLDEYTYSAAHDFLDDVPAPARIASSGNLASKTITGGVFDAADPTFTSVTGAESEAVIVYIDTGTVGTSRLIGYFDTGVTGLPVTPNGGDIDVTFNASGIFAL
jgi:hypothetical protein